LLWPTQKLSPEDLLIERSQQHVRDCLRISVVAHATKLLFGAKIGCHCFVRPLRPGAALQQQFPVTGEQFRVGENEAPIGTASA
jgi:hypothetical protein